MNSNGSTATGANGAHGEAGFGQRIDSINSTAQQLIDEAKGAVNDLQASIDLKGRVERNPYGTLLAAVGVGYVLGGGLFTSLTASLVRMGVKLAALPFVKEELSAMAQSALHGIISNAGKGDGDGGGGSTAP